MKVLLWITMLLSVTVVLAQAPDTLWTKRIGGIFDQWCRSAKQTSDRGYIIAGQSQPIGYFYLVKTDSDGHVEWERNYKDYELNGGIFSVELTSDGGYISAGYVHITSKLRNQTGLLRTDGAGNVVWTRKFKGGSSNVALCVKQTTDNGFIIGGYESSFTSGDASQGAYLKKLNAAGETLWTRSNLNVSSIKAVNLAVGGGYIVLGNSSECHLMRINDKGETLWSNEYCGEGQRVIRTDDGGYILAGRDRDAFLLKVDSLGNTLWDRTYKEIDIERINDVDQTADGGYVVVGNSTIKNQREHKTVVFRVNSSGDILWTQTNWGSWLIASQGGWFGGTSIEQCVDGGYLIAGYATIYGEKDIYLIKTRPDLWFPQE